MTARNLVALGSLCQFFRTCMSRGCHVRQVAESILLQTNTKHLHVSQHDQSYNSPELAAVYDFWDDVNKQHTFHFTPAWHHANVAEVQGGLQFYAPRTQQPGTFPVYDWWDDINKQHTFHMVPAWTHGGTVEHRGGVQFYAYEKHMPGTEPVYAFWDDINKQHTFHFGSAWKHGDSMELKGSRFFYAYSNTRTGAANCGSEVELKPVFDFWDDGNKQHTFHMLPPWSHEGSFEQKGDSQFCAYDGPFKGTEPVYDFWDTVNEQHTFHFVPAWKNEIMKEVQFYAFRNESLPRLVALHDFWDDVNKQHTFHVSPEWSKEKQGDVQFYAFVCDNEAAATTLAPPLTSTPTLQPTVTPTFEPTVTPTLEPTSAPTLEPTLTPTFKPTLTPTTPVPTTWVSDTLAWSCHTCVDGDSCFRDVRWAMNHGVYLHPEWYVQLGDGDCFEQFQSFLHQRQLEDEHHWRGMVHRKRPLPVPLPCKANGPSHMRFGLLYCR